MRINSVSGSNVLLKLSSMCSKTVLPATLINAFGLLMVNGLSLEPIPAIGPIIFIFSYSFLYYSYLPWMYY